MGGAGHVGVAVRQTHSDTNQRNLNLRTPRPDLSAPEVKSAGRRRSGTSDAFTWHDHCAWPRL